ncbi:MAG: hypothetical protein HOC91_14945 [Nitrospinaceae bacterium]|jgi:hypothetical protein|nr:hypothetical protein [Nitrospinaceae bacterium]MBT3435098.1 hypothetical protein [Nitrospinaceae bacterium]MBT3819780.1 hypothetical protein [Nitrospinaceae bacterium]MBT4094697.1 hypothetical protein [Nitrospinaceae bacterium]MBT4431805.1 hypothetical protein [Nitrospinaceae bacterium]
MASTNGVALGIMFLWLLVLTVAFILHWIKIERHHVFDKHWGSKVSDNLKAKIIGE